MTLIFRGLWEYDSWKNLKQKILRHPSFKGILHWEKKQVESVDYPKNLALKGLSHEIDFKNFEKNLQNLA